MSALRCCVPDCNKCRADNVILHLFPNPLNEPERFRSWLYAIGGDILALDNNDILKNRRVCHNHFEDKFKTRNRRLAANAIPTLNLPGFATRRRQPLVEIMNRNAPQDDTTVDNSHDAAVSMAKILATSSTSNLTEEQSPKSSGKGSQKNRKAAKIFCKDTTTIMEKLRKMKLKNKEYKLRLKKAMNLAENQSFLKAMSNFTSIAAMFTLLQFKEFGKPKMGRRFTDDEKVMSLAFFKISPKMYRWLRKAFVLPAPVTLIRMITRAGLRTGINNNIFNHLMKRGRKMTSDAKLCILLFDEIALTPHLDYNRRKDKIIGLVDNGKERKQEIADHALVFMIRGILKNYKQPVAYTFCRGTTNTINLAMQIEEIIKKLHSIGFTVLCTVCDQGTTNVSAIKYLIDKTTITNKGSMRDKVFEIDGKMIIPLFDPPHLIKGIRNNLLNKDLKYCIDGVEKTAKWSHVISLYEENAGYKGIRLMPKLTDAHVYPEKIAKMKVKCATQVFSRTVASNMGYLADKGILAEECRDTADLLLFFDELFDSFNGSYENFQKRKGKPLLGPVRDVKDSNHRQVWLKAKNVLKSMKFVTTTGQITNVPTINNWVRTIENMEKLLQVLSHDYDVKSLWLRHFNQDPLENFFGAIRSHGGRNVSPTCAGFESAFAALLINNLSGAQSPGANCEADMCTTFDSMKEIFYTPTEDPDKKRECFEVFLEDTEECFENFEEKMSNPKHIAQLQYVSGYVLRHLKKKITCKKCLSSLYATDKEASYYLKLRERIANKKCLVYPNNNMVQCFSQTQDVVTKILREKCKIDNIRCYLNTMLSIVLNYDFLLCQDHKKEVVENIQETSCNFFLFNYCKDVNRLLCGKRTDFDDTDQIQIEASKYYKKRYKIRK